MRSLLLCLLPCVCAQSVQPVRTVADCGPFNFTITAVGAAPGASSINNLANGMQCDNWVVSYSSTGFSALSIVFQDAPDSSGVPGSWVTFAGTIISGSNPSTATTSAAAQFNGYYPWVRVYLTSKTGAGTITGLLSGYRSRSASAIPQPTGLVTTFALLGAATAGLSPRLCTDCAVTSSVNDVCAGSGTGAEAFVIAGGWHCFQ